MWYKVENDRLDPLQIFLIGNEQIENARDRRRGHIDFSPLVAKHIECLHTMICVRGSVPTGKCI